MKPLLIILLVAACTVFGQSRARGGVGRSFGSSPRGASSSARPPLLPHPQHGIAAVVPYPVFYGGYYNYDPSLAGGGYPPPAPGYYDDPNAAPSQGPVVIMNQAYRPDMVGNPVTRDYSDSPLPQAYDTGEQQATIYLIALKDQTILSAIAYWAEGDTLTYITPEGTQNRISLALVDRDFSKTLNDDRHVEFKLPKP